MTAPFRFPSGSWAAGPLLPFDLESTAPDPKAARPVSGYVGVAGPDGKLTMEADWLVRLPEDVLTSEQYAAAQEAAHGIPPEKLRVEGVSPPAAVGAIIDTLIDWSLTAAGIPKGSERGAVGAPIAGMNLSYDLTLLHCEALRCGVEPFRDRCRRLGISIPVVDIRVLDQEADRYRRGKRKLADLARNYHIPLENAHAADDDAIAAVNIAREIARQYPRLGRMTAQQIHHAQVGWRKAQCFGLQAYFRGKEPDPAKKAGIVVDPCWPACYPESHQEPAAPKPRPAPEVLF